MWNIDLVFSELKKQKENGKSQRGLAEHCGVAEQQVPDWKRGRIKNSWTLYLPKIAEYIGAPIEAFNDEREYIKNPPTVSGEGKVDEELISLLCQLNQEELLLVDSYVKLILSAHKE